jgi:TPR repeat protein
MKKNYITTKHTWAPPIHNSSHDNLSNDNLYITNKIEPLTPSNEETKPSFYKNKTEKDIVDGIVALPYKISDKNKKQGILDYLKEHNVTSNEIFNWLSNNQSETNPLLVLGDFHYLGIAAMVDKKKAYDYYVKAGEKGSCVAQYTLGVLCENEFDDSCQALYWYNEAAKQGNQEAVNNYYRLQTSNARTIKANMYSIKGRHLIS